MKKREQGSTNSNGASPNGRLRKPKVRKRREGDNSGIGAGKHLVGETVTALDVLRVYQDATTLIEGDSLWRPVSKAWQPRGPQRGYYYVDAVADVGGSEQDFTAVQIPGYTVVSGQVTAQRVGKRYARLTLTKEGET